MKLYYFSKPQLQYVEIKNFKVKLASYFILTALLFSSMIFGIYNFIYDLTNPPRDIKRLKRENEILKSSLLDVKEMYKVLNKSIDSLSNLNNELRVAANLPPVSEEEKLVGVGGGSFNNAIDYLSGNMDEELTSMFSFVEEVERKLAFEKNQYTEIITRLEENEELKSSLPAIKPCNGRLAYSGFGMRQHPILNVKRMHEGIDIITYVGTPVFSTGDGKVVFTGYNGGYGLCVEIDHGYGYKTLYAHLSEIKVKRGEEVTRGDMIAKSGNTGLSTGPHLHYEISHKGIKQNPAKFFFDDLEFIN